MRFPIQFLFRRLLAVFVWSAAAALSPASISTVQAVPLACVANNTSCLEAVEGYPDLGSEQKPLILIHGWRSDKSLWKDFENYFKTPAAENLKTKYKLYRYYYSSDRARLSQLGQELRDVLDEVNRLDPQHFGSKQIAIIGHSLGGLIARNFIGQKQENGQKGGERVLTLITLATPHYGIPMSNGPARAAIIGGYWEKKIRKFIEPRLFSPPIDYMSPNRSDAHWDNNFDEEHDLDYTDHAEEFNVTLTAMNLSSTYDSKIIAYGSFIDYGCGNELEIYTCGALINIEAFNFLSDGFVPYESALFKSNDHPTVRRRQLFSYNHSEIVSSNQVFDYINKDLTIDITAPNSNLVPHSVTLSSKMLSPGQSFTASWWLANTGPAPANARSTTVVRINRSPSSAGSIDNLWSVPTDPLAAGASVPQTAPLQAPVTAGTYYVWVIADNYDDVTNQGPNTRDDIQHSEAFTVTAPAAPLMVSGINASYSTTEAPLRQTINLTGSGFSSVNQITWECTVPDGTSCGSIPPWTPANWNGKFTPVSDTSATLSPLLLLPGDPVGVYKWKITFSNASTSVTKSFNVSFTQVGTYATSTAIGAAPNPSAVGQSVSFAASVVSGGGIPTGTVTFKEGANVLGTGTLSNGLANFSTSSLSAGTHTITADYSGTGNFLSSTSNGVGAIVQASPTPQLLVNPSSGGTTGQRGGPFPSIEFQVSASSSNINFTVDQKPYWLDVTPTSGVAGSTPTSIKFTVNPDGKALPPGAYVGEVFFAINGGGPGSIFRNVILTVTAPPTGELLVSPNTGFTSSGDLGGPFSPASFDYFLSATSGSVDYAVSISPAFFNVSSASGSVSTSPTRVTITVDGSATTTPVGTYPSTITFTDKTNGKTQTRTATLVVNELPALQVSGDTLLQWSGNQGGPFTPEKFEYQVTATKGSVDFSIEQIPSWLTASRTSGTASTSPVTVTFTLNGNANSLAPGGHNATIIFRNTTNGKGNEVRLATLLVRATGTGPSLQGLGSLPGDTRSLVFGVSGDGNVAVGLANERLPPDFTSLERAFRWTPENGMVSLGVLPGAFGSQAFGANSDGTVVVGDSSLGGSSYQAFRWANGKMSGLEYLLSGDNSSSARSVNSDGTVVVGWSFGTRSQAVRWVNGSVSGLGFLDGHDISNAYGVNGDGSVVVGFSCSSTNCFPGTAEAFRWDQAGGMKGLGFLSGWQSSTATGVNSDGIVVVGYAQDGSKPTQAFRWVDGSGMTGLGFLPGSQSSLANAVNADGAVVVGQSDGVGQGAFRWTPADGMKSVAELLTAAGVNVEGWALRGATGVSADGTIIIGAGSAPAPDKSWGWIARLPLPAPALQVSPETGNSASGVQGGPFSPSKFTYRLSASSGTVNYTITNVPSWLNASSTSGTVDTTGKTIIFTVNSSANSLPPAIYDPPPIVFTNTTSGQGNTTRASSLTITPSPPGALQMTPGTGISTSGTQGGPFSPSSFSYTLSSTRGTVGYSISGLPSWLTASSTSGAATPAGTTVTFTVNASAKSLAPGPYDATITFTNTSNNQGSQSRAATLTIVAPPPPPKLQISPLTNIAGWGKRGGPFTPESFSFQMSASSDSLDYSISGVPNSLTVSVPLSGRVTTSPTTATFTWNSAAASLPSGVYNPPPIVFTNTTNGQGNTSRTVILSVDPPVFRGAATLLYATAVCSAVRGLSVGGLAESTYRPRLNPSEPDSGLVMRFTGSTASLFRATGDDQMRGPGNYTGHWISDRATSTGSVPIKGTYNFLITPTSITWGSQFVLIMGTITNFANIAGCTIGFRGSYEREPN